MEEKILIIILLNISYLLLGAELKITRTNFYPQKRVEVIIEENSTFKNKDIDVNLVEGSGKVKYLINNKIRRVETYNSAKFNKYYTLSENEELVSKLKETSKISSGSQITIEYSNYEKNKIKYILIYEGNYLILGIGFDDEGRYKYIKEGKCNYNGDEFEEYSNEYNFDNYIVTKVE